MYTEEQYILEIGQALADDHAAVMVGADFSKNAEKISTAGREFLNWNQLSDLFYEKLYGDSEYPEKITVVPCAWRKKSRLWLDGQD